jgi:hypothetical protein
MRLLTRLLFFLFLLRSTSVFAQANDGFQRRDGTMYVIRNGEIRPMPHDVHLPNGRLITRDGFVVQRDGRRTELRDGQACTLLGEATTISRTPNGRLQLAGAPPVPAARYQRPELKGWEKWLRGRGKAKGKHKRKKHDD